MLEQLWNYEQLRAAAELELNTLKLRADEPSQPDHMVERLLENARGVFYLWNTLAADYAPEADKQLLLNLAVSVGARLN